MSTAQLSTLSGVVTVETVGHDDPHPRDACRPDGSKLALVNCQCRFCLDDMMRRDRDRLEGKGW